MEDVPVDSALGTATVGSPATAPVSIIAVSAVDTRAVGQHSAVRRDPCAGGSTRRADRPPASMVSPVGGDFDGVGRLGQRADLAGRVAVVSFALRIEHLLERGRLALVAQVGQPSPGSLLGAGRQEELAVGVGKRHGALVAALGHHVPLARPWPAATRPDVRANDRVVGRVAE